MSEHKTKVPQGSARALAPLPAHYAFVVQLGRDSDPALRRFVGQIEHLASGRRERFSTQQEMLTVLERTLAQSMVAPRGHASDDGQAGNGGAAW